ncbi:MULTISPECIES: hypothetical protein [unclassified Pseudoalteromonas]|uniref:hypothetical protein n=1 Tax=unclassified Pseudoalteromonas TaxID=194690 RepID=UPI001F2F2A5A|nr:MULTISPECIES: hypothetical protein [unclassified Pseudoalteromonas]MCF2826903.1 hypothetical protein [Pseudoalteromonas sp. OF5H-5]MCF2830600.1 hypothetical protein [Pseudoalteromonas sp. DL2-H6]MCF2923968.1 hypothetical protein [Pseudoalteromonas sp. DL2-H1]
MAKNSFEVAGNAIFKNGQKLTTKQVGEELRKLQALADDLDTAVCEEIENRDRWEERASKLAYAVGEYFGESVGEHSSANCPIENAHELLNQI